jgi:RNA methyltransferase, RsmE family
MNIVALEPEEVGARLPRSDRRWEHIKKILKKGPGDRLAAGLLGGSPLLGEAIVRELEDDHLVLDFEPFSGEAAVPPSLAPLILVLGFPRPIQANRILKDLTSLGVSAIHLTGTELGEKSYAQSTLFKEKDFRAPLVEGAEQAGNPRLPEVRTHWTLSRCMEALESGRSYGSRVFLHPYGEQGRMGELGRDGGATLKAPITLAIGSERGWTDAELELLRAAGFEARSLGSRILKTETAATAAVVLALASLGLL